MKYMQAAKHGGTQSQVDRIVIHGTVSPCVRGGALNVARYFQSAGAGGSAHYTVDPGEVVASVRESVIAHHAPPNTRSIGIELCDPQKGRADRWQDDEHEAMLQRAAVLIRQVAKRWDVPLRRLTVAEVRAGKRGICGHVDVSKAFRQSDHTDPGDAFPWERLMFLVCSEDEPIKIVLKDGVPQWPGRLLRYPNAPDGLQRAPMTIGEDVLQWQTRMRELGYKLTVDGRYGPESTKVCELFQHKADLEVDGVVGRRTWDAAFQEADA